MTAAAAGVRNAQAGVLKGLYGVGADVTVSGAAPTGQAPKSGQGGTGTRIMMGPNSAQMCVNGKCTPLKNGYTIDNLGSPSYGPIAATEVAKVAALHDVTAAADGLLAGAFGSWRVGRMRPADAIAKVG